MTVCTVGLTEANHFLLADNYLKCSPRPPTLQKTLWSLLYGNFL